MCNRIYIFNLKANKQAKKTATRQKPKETKEEKRISVDIPVREYLT